MNTCLKGNLPAQWGTTITVPIHKKGDTENPGNYRPISLLNTSTKLFTSLIAARVQEYTEKHGIIHDNQAAYRKGRGCEDHVYTLNAMIQKQLNKQSHGKQRKGEKVKYGRLFACFIDLAAAFDSCNHDKLWKRLEQEGLSTAIIAKITELYSHAQTRVRMSGKLTEAMKIEKGVLQGETLSPTLFSIFLNVIVTKLQEELHGVRWGSGQVPLLLYADDQVLVSSHAGGLKRLINKIAELFDDMDLKVNLTKTKVMVFRRGVRLPEELNFTWKHEQIEIVNEYVYLGVKFSSSGIFKKAKTAFFKKANTVLQNLKSLIIRSRIKDVNKAHKLLISLVTSILLYGAPTWGLQYVDEFEKFQTGFLRWFLRLSNAAPGYFIRIETGVTNIRCIVFKHVLGFLHRMYMSKSKIIQHSLTESRKNRKNGARYSWWKQLDYLFQYGGLHGEVEKLSAEYLKENYNRILAQYCLNVQSKDIENTQTDHRLQEFMKRKQTAGPSEYIKSHMGDDMKKLLINVRSNFPRVVVKGKVTNLNAVWSTWKSKTQRRQTECQLCNMKEKEDIHHVMLRCPHYRSLRNKYFGERLEQSNRREENEDVNRMTWMLIYSDDTETLERTCNFWTCAMKIREIYLDLMGDETE